MVDAQFTEDEQVEKLKSWWKTNGSSVVVGVAIGLAAVGGYNWWQSSNQARAETASGLYEEMLIRHSEGDVQTAQQMGGTLMDDYAATPYSVLGALFMARMSVEADDTASAAEQLRWVIDNTDEVGMRHIATLRLADILIATQDYDAAESLLNSNKGDNEGGFNSQYHELLGDLYVATDRADEARSAYERSLELLAPGSSYREVLMLKRDNVAASGADTVSNSDN